MIIEKAYAKLNLGLEVVGKRNDGYHDLDMLMVSVDLYDELLFTDCDEVIVESPDFKHIPIEDNLIYKAIILLKNKFDIYCGVRVDVRKHIPEQAGLAGGSADAAATLRGLNRLWNLGLSLEQLAMFAEEIGSDVPYCIYNKLSRVKGRGEKVELLNKDLNLYAVIVIPTFKSSTKEIFKNYHSIFHSNDRVDLLLHYIYSKESQIGPYLFNDLEIVYKNIDIDKYNELNNIKKTLIECGSMGAIMSGSGSAIYGLTNNLNNAKNIENKLKEKFNNYRFEVAKMV